MPLYEYECPDGHKFERARPMSEASDDALCGECGAVAKRLMSVASFSVGWRLKEECHEIGGPRDEFEKDM